MARRRFVVLAFLFSCFLPPAAAWAGFPLALKDDRGAIVKLQAVPRRIVSLAPNLTEIVFLLGEEKRLAGVTRYCNFPPGAADLPKVGGIVDPDVERIVAARPDLVLCTTDGNPKERVLVLEEAGIPCFAVSPQDLQGIFRAIERIGELLGVRERAGREASLLRARAAKAAAAKGTPGPSVLFMVSASPVIAAGSGTFLDELVRLSGGKNAASRYRGRYPRLSGEDLVAAAPEIVLVAAMEGLERLPPELLRLREVPAFRDGEIVNLPGDLVTRPGPRMVEGLEEVSRALSGWRERHRGAAAPRAGAGR